MGLGNALRQRDNADMRRALTDALGDADDLAREHIAWALQQVPQ